MSISQDELERFVGHVVAQKYLLQRLLGAGGMGAVFEAKNQDTGRRVALKLMLASLAQHQDQVDRFLREARAASKMEHPNIVQVFDVGRDADGSFFIVQEFLQGKDLRALLDERGALSPKEARTLLAPVMSALAATHREGVVHRDIKPDNIFVAELATGERVAKLIDFGIAKLTSAGPENLSVTRTGAAIGTPLYMSPEQARGDRSLDGQTDIWSIGVVLFEALTGRTPFTGDSYNEVLAKILTQRAPRLDELAPGAPSDITAVVARALEPSRALRYKTMDELLEAVSGASSFSADVALAALRRSSVRPDAETLEAGALAAQPTIDERSAVPIARSVATPAASVVSVSVEADPSESSPAVQMPVERRAKAPAGALIGAVVALVAVSVVGVIAAGQRGTASVAQRATVRAPIEPAVTTDAAFETRASATGDASVGEMVIAITASPASAVIEVDGQRSVGAFAGRIARTGASHSVRVSAAGFVARELTFVDSPPEGRVVLERLAVASQSGARAGTRTTGASTSAASANNAQRSGPMQREYE